MKIDIIGLGWFGGPLALELLRLGHEVSGTTRSEKKQKEFLCKNIHARIFSYPEIPEVLEADIIVLNIPPFAEELKWFQSWPLKKNQWVIFISSTSLKDILLEQEEWVKNNFTNWTILRFGGLFGDGRHPGKHLAGRKNLSGRLHPVNLIHRDDTIGATLAVIEKRILLKTISVVSSEHPTREEYYIRYCKDHGMALPEFDPDDNSQGKLVPNEDLLVFYCPERGLD